MERQDETGAAGRSVAYYRRAADAYAATWDDRGRMHWGYFDEASGPGPDGLARAIDAWDALACRLAGITQDSTVLDLGCGTGATAAWLARTTGCAVVGADLHLHLDSRPRTGSHVRLVQADAMRLPFQHGAFTHVWSQAMLCHVEDRAAALDQIRWALRPGGLLVLDDIITPAGEVSDLGRRFYYDRVAGMRPQPDRRAYLAHLRSAGFTIERTMDLTAHMRTSYERATDHVRGHSPETAAIYQGVIRAIDAGDVGWAFFLCRRP
ncbi:class I SAM-dependent methyltransferase [Streptomyces sp. NBC_00996]|uniref:class I SAM-dependent methyltransferase n=1 Tax=Streptomyces sp. NBC_00996 TaxID=2903710 RepID=UPI0038694832|nr:class I SAM-dependent methyltransferase [Streptomyces sp. NBC_00996]